jgi:bifunctional oligoribonuclease and PAP phosphatase NrnA
MFKERIDGSMRINFRSRGNVRTNRIARQFGGGGHEHASGIVSGQSLEILMPQVLEAMQKEVQKSDNENTTC